MSMPTPRTDEQEWAETNRSNAVVLASFARELERELAQAWKGEEVASRDFRMTLADLGQARRELITERQKVRVLTAILESICEEWGRNHDANPIGAGQRMETLASKALEDMEDAE